MSDSPSRSRHARRAEHNELAERHVPDAINIPHTRLRAHLDNLSPECLYYVHCATGARAATAAALLARHGFRAVHVDGAFEAWRPSAVLLVD